MDEVEQALGGENMDSEQGQATNRDATEKGPVYLADRGEWRAGNVTLHEISGEDGREGDLVNVNGGKHGRGVHPKSEQRLIVVRHRDRAGIGTNYRSELIIVVPVSHDLVSHDFDTG